MHLTFFHTTIYGPARPFTTSEYPKQGVVKLQRIQPLTLDMTLKVMPLHLTNDFQVFLPIKDGR